ncbi:MAG: excinuclease ABC subunit UvrC [Bryobacterales bacterium]|nr:excinuclease ABC subunit UvrC [Bryobacterales bacterium]MDE0624326.1 excinuclease ABC subunit UvrC [Bryobacterales bacterium]
MPLPPHWDELRAAAWELPATPGIYQFIGRDGKVLYIGKAKSLRDRVRSYFSNEALADAKRGGLLSESRSISNILVSNEKEALALENNLIKQHKPKYNILLRDDKTYPYIKLTKEKYPRVYVTRRLKKDGSTYFGPYFPGNLAHRLVHFIHRHFKLPSCSIDLTRTHPRPCLEYHIHRCWGPCVKGLVPDDTYQRAAEDVRAFLGGRRHQLVRDLRERMLRASEDLEFEKAASLRNLITTVEEITERQRMAAAEGRDIDIFGVHAEPPLVAANIFHVRNGRVVDRREFYWEDAADYDEAEFLASLLPQVYLGQRHVPALVRVQREFEGMAALAELLAEDRGAKVEIAVPVRGSNRALLDLVVTNARSCFEQRFRVRKPTAAQMAEAWRDALNLPPAEEGEKSNNRIECFDVSHTQGTEVVASMVVWENGRMKKSAYRKFIVSRQANDDFAAMREVVRRRYSRLQAERKGFPLFVLVDGGIGQLHAAAEALEELGAAALPLAAIAKREEVLYVFGQEDEPLILDRFSPILHAVQQIRDEAHRFAITFHRQRRSKRALHSELLDIPGVGENTARKLLTQFGSVAGIRESGFEDLSAAVGRQRAAAIRAHFAGAAEGQAQQL